MSFHVGDEVIHLDEWYDKPVSIDASFSTMDQMTGWLESTGFEIKEKFARALYVEVEYASTRGYINAKKP